MGRIDAVDGGIMKGRMEEMEEDPVDKEES